MPSVRSGLEASGVDEMARGFLQRRLAIVFGMFGALVLTFWVVGAVAVGVRAPNAFWAIHASRSKVLEVVAGAFLGALFLLCRGPTRSRAVLAIADVAGAFVLFSIVSVALASAPVLARESLVAVPAVLFVVITRAALVPTPPAWTAFVAAAAAAPVAVGAFATSRPVDRTALEVDIAVPLVASIFSFAGVLSAWTVSKVVYGLRVGVKAATRIGRYTLEERIGQGGMGVVYKARHALLQRPTALKLLLPDRMDPTALARFEREVQVTASLTHPNTISIYDYGRTQGGLFYYVMELVDGVSLQVLVARDGPLPAGRAVRLLAQAAGALVEAHEAGLIHRDVKPENILVCRRRGIPDFVKVVDFGLVKELRQGAPNLSDVSLLAGTPLYLAPESIERPERIDARVDVYALGAVAYFLLTGRPPFEGHNLIEICSQHLHTAPTPPSQLGATVPPVLERFVLDCLSKSPDDRPSSAELLARLDACALESPWRFDRAGRPQLQKETSA